MIRSSKIVVFLLFAVGVFALPANAQRAEEVGPGQPPVQRPMAILRQLGLSEDQIRAMRVVNSESREKRQAARLRVTEATRMLDQAVYADQVDETAIAKLLTDLQAAQAEVVKINFENELAVRKILTPEQLVNFREIRRRFNEDRKDIRQRRQERFQRRRETPPPGASTRPVTQKPVKRGND